mmetsp:Transcript_24276/g.57296  ORF Transcript_24276/g.57296 Transcript_24276/m.57296 type:complete len:545 (-) Transcript_24276:1006-2640(-)
MGTAGVEHEGFSTLQKTGSATTDFGPPTVFGDADKHMLLFELEKCVSQGTKIEIRRYEHQRVLLVVPLQLGEKVLDKVIHPGLALVGKGCGGDLLKDLFDGHQNARDGGISVADFPADLDLSRQTLSEALERREKCRIPILGGHNELAPPFTLAVQQVIADTGKVGAVVVLGFLVEKGENVVDVVPVLHQNHLGVLHQTDFDAGQVITVSLFGTGIFLLVVNVVVVFTPSAFGSDEHFQSQRRRYNDVALEKIAVQFDGNVAARLGGGALGYERNSNLEIIVLVGLVAKEFVPFLALAFQDGPSAALFRGFFLCLFVFELRSVVLVVIFDQFSVVGIKAILLFFFHFRPREFVEVSDKAIAGSPSRQQHQYSWPSESLIANIAIFQGCIRSSGRYFCGMGLLFLFFFGLFQCFSLLFDLLQVAIVSSDSRSRRQHVVQHVQRVHPVLVLLVLAVGLAVVASLSRARGGIEHVRVSRQEGIDGSLRVRQGSGVAFGTVGHLLVSAAASGGPVLLQDLPCAARIGFLGNGLPRLGCLERQELVAQI